MVEKKSVPVKKNETVEIKDKSKNSNEQKVSGAEKVLIENFVSLQRVMTNLAVKFDNLSSQISKLLELFEISAKTLAEHGPTKEEKKIVERLDNLLEQNKVIAKGIALLHEKGISEQQYITPMPPMQRIPIQGQIPERRIIEKEIYKESSAQFPNRPPLKKMEI